MKKKSTAKLKRELWVIFSKYVRERDHYSCFTCDYVGHGSSIHAGHFIPASVGGLSLYFHEDNVHAQCIRCNLWLQGNQYEYGIRLGKRRVDKLNKLRNKVVKWSETDYLKKIELYKKKYKKLVDEKNK